MNPIPSVLALLICERTIEEAQTTKKTLVGVFSALHALTVPAQLAFGIYARLIDAEGEYNFVVRLSRTDSEGNEHLLGQAHAITSVPSRLTPIELAVNLPPIQFGAFGRYEIQLYGNDVYLGHASLDVVQIEEST
jgi:hypothetical protein